MKIKIQRSDRAMQGGVNEGVKECPSLQPHT